MTKTKRVLAGVTEDKELYFIETSITDRNGYDEFTMSGFTVRPVTEEDKKEYESTYLDGEEHYYWKEAVASGSTQDSMEDWIQQVRDEGDNMDCSLYPETVEVDNTTYYFESQSCGQHEVYDLVDYAMSKNIHQEMMTLWSKYHLKAVSEMTTEDRKILDEIMDRKQDEEAEVIKAVEYINNN